MELIKKYFPDLSAWAIDRLEKLMPLYAEWNEQINVVSRKDIEHLYLHHVLHSLSVAKFVSFRPDCEVLDLGCGGGFPGIPLAIFFPETKFHLVDARAKKLKVVGSIVESLELKNVTYEHVRAESLNTKYDFVLARAVTSIDKLNMWSMPLIHTDQKHGQPNGLIAFKGGDIKAELKTLPKKAYYEQIFIKDFFEEPYFEEKYLVYVQR